MNRRFRAFALKECRNCLNSWLFSILPSLGRNSVSLLTASHNRSYSSLDFLFLYGNYIANHVNCQTASIKKASIMPLRKVKFRPSGFYRCEQVFALFAEKPSNILLSSLELVLLRRTAIVSAKASANPFVILRDAVRRHLRHSNLGESSLPRRLVGIKRIICQIHLCYIHVNPHLRN